MICCLKKAANKVGKRYLLRGIIQPNTHTLNRGGETMMAQSIEKSTGM